MTNWTNLVFALSLVFPNWAVADNWPQWRGNSLNSLSNEVGLPDALGPKTLLWKFEMPGPGGSSPIVWEDRIFVASVDGSGLALLCVTIDGKLKWKKTLQGETRVIRMDNSNGASPSPVTDGRHVWVMLTPGIVHCFDFDGNLVWKRDLQQEYGKFAIQFGMTSTPLLDHGHLYFQLIHGSMRNDKPSRGKIVALEAKTGKEVWVHERNTPGTKENKHAYTSPTIFRSGAKEFLVVHGADYVTGHSMADGQELWRVGGFNPVSTYNPFLRFVSSPVCSSDLIVVPSAKNGPVFGIRPTVAGDVDSASDSVKWILQSGTPDVATPVISKTRVYLARENGVLTCLSTETGEPFYSERIMRDKHRSTPVAADGKVYVITRDGKALVIADQDEFKLISEHDLEEDTTASPAIANGVVYIRTNQSLMAFRKK